MANSAPISPQPVPAKSRDDWYLRRSAFPLRDAPPFELESIANNPSRYPRARDIRWVEAGPRNYAGRVTCLLSDTRNRQILYAGSAAGGLWRSPDLGRSWEPAWPKFLNQNIGALAADPNFPDQLICATGEGNLSSGTYPGGGIFSSMDQGFTWASFLQNPDGGPVSGVPRRIASVAFGAPKAKGGRRSPIAFGCVTKDDSLHAGLFLDMGPDGLVYIDRWGNRSYNCYSVVFHPSKSGLLYVGIEPRGTLNGIWRSEDFGKSWTQLNRLANSGLPAGEHCGRISLAISPANPKVLYALIGGRGRLLGIYKTEDGGDTWIQAPPDVFSGQGQLNYNNTIAAHPSDPDFAICGINDLFRTRNGGKEWERISTGRRDGGTPERLPHNFVHSDQHAIVILEQENRPPLLIAGHDGGVSISEDGGDRWDDRSHGMVTTMFYDVDVCAANSRVFGGGAQDAGSLIAGVRPNGSLLPKNGDPTAFTRVLPGDGGWMVFDPANPKKVFAASADSLVQRHDPGQPFSNGLLLGGWVDIPPPLTRPERFLRALTLLAVRPASRGRAQQIWLGTSRLWCTLDEGATWQPASDFFDNSAVSALEFSSADPNLILVGTTAGSIFRSRDNGATWSADLAGPDIPRRVITQIRIHPMDPTHLFVAVGSSTVSAAALRGDATPYSHVFCSEDQGDTWKDIDGGALPNVVYNGLAIEARPPHRVFAGGDAGVWSRGETGAWINISGNIPNAIISDLVYHAKDNILTAATYGRGIWRLEVPEDPFLPDPAAECEEEAGSSARCPAEGLLGDSTVPSPVLVSPEFDAIFTTFPRRLRFAWKPVPGAIGYVVSVRTELAGAQIVTAREAFLDHEHHSDGAAFWRVWALHPESRRSPHGTEGSFFFFTGEGPVPERPELRAPADGALAGGGATPVRFSWSPMLGVTGYTLSIGSAADPASWTHTSVPTPEIEMLLPGEGELIWYVRPEVAGGERMPASKRRRFRLRR
jgi:photosystem II stability/assembly factor-like uncharacterized protein